MKVRGDFVTNSSSVSYILTMDVEFVDSYMHSFGETGVGHFLKFIKEEMEEKGQEIKVGDRDFQYMKITFDDSDTSSLDEFTNGETLVDIDFSTLSDDAIWRLIRWNIVRGNTFNLWGIGATQIDTY